MLNVIPVVGWIIDFFLKVSLAVPFWVVWSGCGIGEKFFYFLPRVFTDIGFWETVGVFIVLSILKGFSPFSVSSNSNSKNN